MTFYEHNHEPKGKLPVGTEGVPDIIKEATGKDGMIKIKSDGKKMFQYASDNLYEDPDAAPREITNNEARQVRTAIRRGYGVHGDSITLREWCACHAVERAACCQRRLNEEANAIAYAAGIPTAKKPSTRRSKKDDHYCGRMEKCTTGAPYKVVHDGHNITEGVKIICHVNEVNREITIHGEDSMGMTVEDFEEIYSVSGRSGNTEVMDTGMFGIGKLAYRAVSDTMKFETWARDSNERYGFIMKGTDMEPTPCKLETYGTRVTLIVREDVDMKNLREYFRKKMGMLDVTTYLKTTIIKNVSGLVPATTAKKGSKNKVNGKIMVKTVKNQSVKTDK